MATASVVEVALCFHIVIVIKRAEAQIRSETHMHSIPQRSSRSKMQKISIGARYPVVGWTDKDSTLGDSI